MMTSGEAVKYASSMDAARKIMAAEGIRSFFKGAGANILRGVAGAGVLSIYDRKFCATLEVCVHNILTDYRGSAAHVRQGLQGWIWLNYSSDVEQLDLQDWLDGVAVGARGGGSHASNLACLVHGIARCVETLEKKDKDLMHGSHPSLNLVIINGGSRHFSPRCTLCTLHCLSKWIRFFLMSLLILYS